MSLQDPKGLQALATTRVLGTAIVLILVLWGFGDSVRHGSLNYDDPMYLADPGGVSEGLSLKSLAWSLTATRSNLWHPLTWLTFQIECALAGGSRWQMALHHATNLLLYLATLVVLAMGMARLKLPVWASVAFLALFGLHPLHVESVAWISSRKDVLSGFFQALCLLAYLGERNSPRQGRSLTFFALALLSKPSAVITPLLLILIDEALGKKEGRPSLFASLPGLLRHLGQKRWFWFMALLAAGATIWVQAHGTMAGVAQSSGLFERLALVPARIGAYFGKIMLPLQLTFEYSVPGAATLLAFTILGLALVLLPLVDFLRTRSFSWLGLAFLWMLACLAPVLGLFLVSDSFINDRYAFWALAGPLAWLIGASAKMASKPRLAVGIVMVVLLVIATKRQVRVWRSDEQLFGHALAVNPDHLTALGNMGTLERSRGNENLALTYYERALQVNPRDHIVLYNKAQILARRGLTTEAVEACRLCLEAYPTFEGAQILLRHLQSLDRKGLSPSR